MIRLPTSYQGKTIGVFGLGKSGNATLSCLAESGVNVCAWDDKEQSRSDAPVHENIVIQPFAQWPWKQMQTMILSPGIPLTHPAPHEVVKQAASNDVTVTGDIFLLRESQAEATYVGITGTNGKSTTTTLTGHLLKQAGKTCEVGGNLGTPVLSFAPLGKGCIYVLELSSYQTDLNPVRINIGAILNITPDHLDRHGGMEGYIAAKEKMFALQQKGDVAIVAVDDTHTSAMADRIEQHGKAELVRVSVTRDLKNGISVQHGIVRDGRDGTTIDLNGISSLMGAHNWQNAGIAYAIARAAGVEAEAIARGMKTFPGLRHRMQLVTEVNGVRFINDSKATNAEATENALKPFETIYWIIGGQAKAGGITALETYFPKIAHAFLMGEAEDDFARTLEGKVKYTKCGHLTQAFAAARDMAYRDKKKGAVVLLSPACASWDQWKSFEHRGDAFVEMAEQEVASYKLQVAGYK